MLEASEGEGTPNVSEIDRQTKVSVGTGLPEITAEPGGNEVEEMQEIFEVEAINEVSKGERIIEMSNGPRSTAVSVGE